MITIFTRSPRIFSLERLKSDLKNLRGQRRGPKAVLESLTRGLNIIGQQFEINPPLRKKFDIVHIISGIDALRWAISEKKKGNINSLVAGPNLVVTPDEEDGIIQDPAIDIILQPSKWTVDLFASIAPAISGKIKSWPAGVEMIPHSAKPINSTLNCVIYKKSAPEKAFDEVVSELNKSGISHTTVVYGTFTPQGFYKLLEKADFMVYLSASESQGLALQEAWVRDIPTLVYQGTRWHFKGHTWADQALSAPYLTPQAGMFFGASGEASGGSEGFNAVLKTFVSNLQNFKPREYVENTLSDEKSARIYTSLIL